MERQINKCFCIQCFYTVLETMNLAYGSLEMEKKNKGTQKENIVLLQYKS